MAEIQEGYDASDMQLLGIIDRAAGGILDLGGGEIEVLYQSSVAGCKCDSGGDTKLK